MSRPCLTVALALALVGSSTIAAAQGFLVGRTERLEPLVLGTEESGYGVSVEEYQLTTGQGYTLFLESSGLKPYAMVSPDGFFNYIWVRKIEAGDVEIKVNGIYELEMEEESELAIFFTPIRPGTYTLHAKGLEDRVSTRFVVE